MNISLRNSKTIYITFWFVYALYVVLNHEIWRDEMRAFSIAVSSNGLLDLIANIKNEGHPILWYGILKIVYFILPNTKALQLISFLIGFTSMVILVTKWKLPSWSLMGYAFTSIMMWDNTIMCRNYGITSLCVILLFPALYSSKFNIAFGLILILTQTSVIGSLISLPLFILTLAKQLGEKKEHAMKVSDLTWIAVYGLFMLFLLYTIIPNNKSAVTHFHDFRGFKIILVSLKSAFFLHKYFDLILNPLLG